MSIGNTRTSSSLAPCFMQLSLVEKWEKITWLRVRRRAQNTQILQRRSRPLLPSWGWEWVHRMGRLFYYLPRLYTWTYATFRLCDTLRLHSHCPHSRSHKNGASSQPFKKINQILRILKKCSPRYGTVYPVPYKMLKDGKFFLIPYSVEEIFSSSCEHYLGSWSGTKNIFGLLKRIQS